MRRLKKKSAFIGVMPAAVHRRVSPRMALPYVWVTPTGATVDVDAPSRSRSVSKTGATRGVHLRFLIFHAGDCTGDYRRPKINIYRVINLCVLPMPVKSYIKGELEL